ncbi:hypothetical protein L484_003313 [Morus notabilis]|uniref:Uncharacterized protein n=1 Tax=Morus notabilis TaxID=981085 RepID=W9RKJ3_9ROSA|nr:hypothetical protein L484_003313 [Morus notabilis]
MDVIHHLFSQTILSQKRVVSSRTDSKHSCHDCFVAKGFGLQTEMCKRWGKTKADQYKNDIEDDQDGETLLVWN